MATPNVYDMVLERSFDAPRELVWKAWTDSEMLTQWWGPKNFTNPVLQANVREGGKIYIEMKAPDGTVYPMAGEYLALAPPERLVFMSGALDAHGRYMFEMINTVTFQAVGSTTVMRLEVKVTATTPMAPQHLQGMREGWSQSLDRLQALVEKSY